MANKSSNNTNTNTNTNNNNNNNTNLTKEQRAAKSAALQAERLEKATSRLEAAKVYEAKKRGQVGEALAESRCNRLSALTLEGLASACVNRAKELTKTHIDKSVMRYLKAEVGNAVRNFIGEDKLPLFVDCGRGDYKIDSAIRYACSSSRNEDIKVLLSALKKASK